MLIAKITGSVASTAKNSDLHGFKILLVEPIDLEGNSLGRELLAVDTVDAGIGDRVMICMEGGSVGTVMGINKAACDAAIVGVIDTIYVEEELK